MNGRTDWPFGVADGWVELGGDHLIRQVDRLGVPAGWIEAHRDPLGEWCAGMVNRNGSRACIEGRPGWAVESEDPLTLSPSVLCTTCGSHGFIRAGRWADA